MSKYDALMEHLATRSEPVVMLSFTQIDALVTGGLPASARQHSAWWANSRTAHAHAAAWLDAGRTAQPDFNSGRVRFPRGVERRIGPRSGPGSGPEVRTRSTGTTRPPTLGPERLVAAPLATSSSGTVPTVQPRTRAQPDHSRRIGLVGCVKEKATSAKPARDLYVSTLFHGRRAYVERSCDEWWILSAKHGLLNPEEVVEPYDQTLKEVGTAARRLWSLKVLEALVERVVPTSHDIIEVHAGAEYRDYGLVHGLRRLGCRIMNPTEGLVFGEQLAFYKSVAQAVDDQ